MIDRLKRRKFGQNYLVDPIIINKIATIIKSNTQKGMFEIGPGKGAITKYLLDPEFLLTAIDIDDKNTDYLEQKFKNKNIKIICGDILDFDYSKLIDGITIFGNLPYNISSKIILNITKSLLKPNKLFFMVQKEVADRICAKPGNKSWGKLGIKTSLFFKNKVLFDISPESFDIKPKVNSSFIEMTLNENVLINKSSFDEFSAFIDLCFRNRRKNLKNNLLEHVDQFPLSAKFLSHRPEQLTMQNFIDIYLSKS